MVSAVRIIGIDPGLQRTGWGVILCDGPRLSYIASGTVRPPAAASMAGRLRAIHDGLAQVLAAHAPQEAAIEETFVSRDAKASLKLGQARGVAMLALALAGLEVAEYAPNLIKKSVVGTGHAEKRQVEAMVRVLLPRAAPDSADAADALAVAICHAHHREAARLRRQAAP